MRKDQTINRSLSTSRSAMTEGAHDYLTGRLTGGTRPAAVGDKFEPTGAVRHWPGNTFICHIPAGPAHQALTAAQARLRAGPLAEAFAFLPPSSLHMTVFEGANNVRRHDDSWPGALSPEMDLSDVTAHFRMATGPLLLPPTATTRPASIFGGFSVMVNGATEIDERKLRDMRSALSVATTIRRADFADYRFHVTMAYPLRWLRDDEAHAVVSLSDAVFADLATAMPTVPLDEVEFCTFEDMHAFYPVTRLRHAQN